MVIEQKFKAGEEPDPTEYLFVSMELRRKLQSLPYDAKTTCWVPDPDEHFRKGEIKGTKGDMVNVLVDNEEKAFKKDQVQQHNPPKYELAEDMTNMTFLNESSVLHNLKQRYVNKLIYTYSGLFCVAINPYKRYPIYTVRAMSIYMNKRRNEVPPHIFAIAEGAYQNMITARENQSILITGESGAGKTENTKKVIAYFAQVGASTKGQEKKVSLEDQIVQTNPVLESFGNAKTTRNDNSSRFGKFIRIHFGPTGKLAGCDIESYLLEKARCISQMPLERCYHIFYQLMSDAIPDMKKMLCLGDDIYQYPFVSQGKITVPSIDDFEEMKMTHEAFEILNFSKTERDDIYKITASCMHMGAMKFKQKGREEQAEADGTEAGMCVAKLLGVDGDQLYTNICKPKIKVGAEFVTKGMNVAQCGYTLGAMTKSIYDRLFKHLIKRCNDTLDTQQKRASFAGVLDIAGFEIFEENGFDQLCINFTNEKLQQFFNHHMFVLEQEEYKKEGLDWIFEDFGMDLQACISLMEMPMGVFAILEEQTLFPKATDQTFIDMLRNTLLGKQHCFMKPKPSKPGQKEAHFAVGHYAGVVQYNITGWLEKNKDPLNDTVVDQYKKGSNNLVTIIYADHPGQSGGDEGGKGGGKKKGGGFRSVTSGYREQLNNLMSTLKATHPHFIRCIIPNEVKTPGLIDAHLVMHQLTCNGVLEGIRICRKGFPNRMAYPDFVFRYQILASKPMAEQKEDKKIATACFETIGLEADKWRVGHTKVFFRAGALGELEEIRDDKITRILIWLQSRIRLYLTKKKFKPLKDQRLALEVVQRSLRSYVKLRCWPWWSLWKILKPTLHVVCIADEMKKFEEKCAELSVVFEAEENQRLAVLAKSTKLQKEFDVVQKQLDELKALGSDFGNKIHALQAQKQDLDMQVVNMNSRVSQEEDARQQLQNQKRKLETDVLTTKQELQENAARLESLQEDSGSKQTQIDNLKTELSHQEDLIAKQQKEKRTLQEQLKNIAENCQALEDKQNGLHKVKTKLERAMDELEDNLEREKKQRCDIEKGKNKIESDLKLNQETLAELERKKKELEQAIQRKDKEISSITSKMEEETSMIARLMRQIKELQGRIDELEEELEIEKQARAKATKARSDLAKELEQLGERLEETGGQTATQIEMNKKREAELVRVRRDVEEANISHEAAMAQVRKRHNDAVSEMGEQIDNLNKNKAKAEKERSIASKDLNELHAAMDQLANEKAGNIKLGKHMQAQIAEMQTKLDNVMRQLDEVATSKKKLFMDNEDMSRQIEESEAQASVLSKAKVSLATQLEDTKRMADEDVRERAALLGKYRNVEHDLEVLREHLEEIYEGKSDIQKQISKYNAEAQLYRAKFESDGLAKIEELEQSKQKLTARLQEAEETIESLNGKSISLEKTKQRLISQMDVMQQEADRCRTTVAQMEKKTQYHDKILAEWKSKVGDLTAELDASKKEQKSYSADLMRTRALQEDTAEAVGLSQRENKNLGEEIKDLLEQISQGGRNMHEIEKAKHRIQIEKDELQAALEDAESTLEQEENKVVRVQLELSQVRQELDRRLQEREEEFENTKRNFQRTLDSMQASLEAEASGKAEALKVKKVLESDINELEIALDRANKSNAEAQKTIKRNIQQIQECHNSLEDEKGAHFEAREEYGITERRANAFANELEESRTIGEQAERARRIADGELVTSRAQHSDLSTQVNTLQSIKRKLEAELEATHGDLEGILNQAKNNEEKAKKAMVDAARLADELRTEQEFAQNQEKAKKSMEGNVRDLQQRLEIAEGDSLKGSKRLIAKLEDRIKAMESELDTEQRRHVDCQKNMRHADRRAKELAFQSDEDTKNQSKMQDLVEKLQNKIRTYKRQIEEAEEIAALNLAKFSKAQAELDDANDRSEFAEAQIARLRPGAGAAAAAAQRKARAPSTMQ